MHSLHASLCNLSTNISAFCKNSKAVKKAREKAVYMNEKYEIACHTLLFSPFSSAFGLRWVSGQEKQEQGPCLI